MLKGILIYTTVTATIGYQALSSALVSIGL